jgi:hypothetical protein
LNRISNLFIATPAGKLSEVVSCYFKIYSLQKNIDERIAGEKAQFVSGMIEAHPKRKEILLMMSKASPLQLAGSFYETDTTLLEQQLKQVFN